MIHNVYCIGTGHDSTERAQLLPEVYSRYDKSPAEQKHLLEGVGSKNFRGFQAPAAPPLPLAGDATPSRARGIVWGKGWGSNVKRVMTALADAHSRTPLTGVNLVGHSRGAVTCHMIAHAIHHVFQGNVPCNIFAFDPVPGGIWDFSTWWELDAGDRATLGLDDKTPELLPPNVQNYFGILMERTAKACFGVLGARRLRCAGTTNVVHLPLYGKHSDCVSSDLVAFPASSIGLSLLLEQLQGWNHVPVDGRFLLNSKGYVEQYSRLYRKWLEKGVDPKNVSNAMPKTVAMGIAAFLLGGLPALGFFSGYWRNRRADDIANLERDYDYFLNYHHADSFFTEPACRQLVERKRDHGWIERSDVERFRAAYRETYVVLVRLGLLRSVNAPPDDVDETAAGERIIDVPPKPSDIQRLTAALADHIPAGGNRLVTGGVYTPEQFRAASYVRRGSRKEQVAEIDKLLPLYFRAKAGGNKARARRLLCRIGVFVEVHLRTKPRSDRRTAMLELARQVKQQLQSP